MKADKMRMLLIRVIIVSMAAVLAGGVASGGRRGVEKYAAVAWA